MKTKVLKSEDFEKVERLIITLHGYGTSGEDFAEVGELYLSKQIKNAVFLYPDAPEKCEAGFGSQWFTLNDLSLDGIRQGLDRIAPILENYITEKKLEYGCENVNLIGFSQGSITALEMIHHTNVSKIVAYSGLFVPGSLPPVSSPDVLLVHSIDDPVVPYTNAENAQGTLSDLDINVKLKTYDQIGHSISYEGWECGVRFLNDVS